MIILCFYLFQQRNQLVQEPRSRNSSHLSLALQNHLPRRAKVKPSCYNRKIVSLHKQKFNYEKKKCFYSFDKFSIVILITVVTFVVVEFSTPKRRRIPNNMKDTPARLRARNKEGKM